MLGLAMRGTVSFPTFIASYICPVPVFASPKFALVLSLQFLGVSTILFDQAVLLVQDFTSPILKVRIHRNVDICISTAIFGDRNCFLA
jgi:hypothetical protein